VAAKSARPAVRALGRLVKQQLARLQVHFRRHACSGREELPGAARQRELQTVTRAGVSR
jgi:hypothetical protein